KTENRKQKTENRKQKTENRKQKTENRKQKTENRKQKTENIIIFVKDVLLKLFIKLFFNFKNRKILRMRVVLRVYHLFNSEFKSIIIAFFRKIVN
ncbi:hypothetical protein, partial [Photorhabdus sp. RM105S]|uniref:hypothetical protein n=1 Tax=Photorhabdus sp. RM105S TaxID=3342823 RepID=UPI0036DD4F33